MGRRGRVGAGRSGGEEAVVGGATAVAGRTRDWSVAVARGRGWVLVAASASGGGCVLVFEPAGGAVARLSSNSQAR